MGFHVEVNSILRYDEYGCDDLQVGQTYSFWKTGSRIFFDDLPVWLTLSNWTALAEIRVVSQTRTWDSSQQPFIKGDFRVLHVYAGAEQATLTEILRRMFETPAS